MKDSPNDYMLFLDAELTKYLGIRAVDIVTARIAYAHNPLADYNYRWDCPTSVY